MRDNMDFIIKQIDVIKNGCIVSIGYTRKDDNKESIMLVQEICRILQKEYSQYDDHFRKISYDYSMLGTYAGFPIAKIEFLNGLFMYLMETPFSSGNRFVLRPCNADSEEKLVKTIHVELPDEIIDEG
jgi:hypothetical protein